MFIFGHIGIGGFIAKPFLGGNPKWRTSEESRVLPYFFLLIGTLLPDLIDKPLYFFARFFSQENFDIVGLISGTRTFGHTVIFVIVLGFLSVLFKSKKLAAITLGVSTHIMLDHFVEYLAYSMGWVQGDWEFSWDSDRISGLLFPFFGLRFPSYPFSDLANQWAIWRKPHLIIGEVVGFLLFLRVYLKYLSKNSE